MKKLIWMIVFAVVAVYGSGRASLSESGVVRTLNQWESLTVQGDDKGMCEMMHEDLQVSMEDHSAGRPVVLEGGKDEFCDYVSEAAPGMRLLVTGMQVRREDLEVERHWLHPWTAEVSYTERRSMTMPGLRLNTSADDRLTLVKTFGGVKIRRIESTTWVDDIK